jgi:cytochrome P450
MSEAHTCPVHHDFDPLGERYQADPYDVLAELPGGERVFYAPALDYHVVTGYEEIERVFLDHETFSAAAAQLPLVRLEPEAARILLAGGHEPQPSMVSLDEPEHRRLRDPTVRALTPRRVAEMEPRIRSTLAALLDAVVPSQPFDLVATLAAPLPMRMIFSLSFAGHETTNNLIGNALRRLLEEPQRWQRLVAEPSLIPDAIEEVLRYDPSVPVWRRVTRRPVTLGGVDLPAGAKLYLWLAAAGRDARAFEDPDDFELGRPNASRHLAFGKGIHYCPGAALGKLETKLALEELTRRFPRLRLVEGQALTFHPNISFRGPQELWVTAGG